MFQGGKLEDLLDKIAGEDAEVRGQRYLKTLSAFMRLPAVDKAVRALRDEDAARARDDDAADAAKAGAKMRMRAAHFELALRDARPSTSATELQRFESWAAAHKDLAWA